MKGREPRHRVIEALYQADLRQIADPAEGLQGRARRYVEGVSKHRDDLDRRIESVSIRWPVRRMAAVDRCILRLALYELLYEPTPTAVVIDEAVELAKRYSTKASGAFVNGILSTLAAQVRPDPDDPSTEGAEQPPAGPVCDDQTPGQRTVGQPYPRSSAPS